MRSNEAPRPTTSPDRATVHGKGRTPGSHAIPLITYAQISSLSEQVSLPVVDIIRALVRHAGDGEAAREMLEVEHVGNDASVGRRIA